VDEFDARPSAVGQTRSRGANKNGNPKVAVNRKATEFPGPPLTYIKCIPESALSNEDVSRTFSNHPLRTLFFDNRIHTIEYLLQHPELRWF
jgi:hypothetical protein